MKFGTRLTIYYLIATLLSLALVGLAVLRGIEHYGMAAVEKQLIEQSDSANVYITQNLLLEKLGPTGLSEISDRVANNLSIGNREVLIYDDGLKLLTASVDGVKQEQITTTSRAKNLAPALEGNYVYYISNDRVYFASAIQLQQKSIGILEFVYPLDFLNQVLTAARNTLYAGAVCFGLLITILSVYIARIVVQPIRQLVESANRFARRDFTPTLDIKRNDELGQLSRSFSDMGSELQHYIQRQRQFVANVSHELRTPLTAIRGYSDYLIDEVKGRPDLEKAVYHLNNESDRLTRLVDELLLLSRIDAGREELLFNRLDLSKLVKEALLKIQAKAAKYNIIICDQLQPGIVVLGDEEKLLQVALNLLDNAIKFSPAGGQVDVQLIADSSNAHLTVADRGQGVPGQSLDKVFDRFYRAPNAKAVGGTGLGLAISQEIIGAHHGSIQLNNRPGGGTTVVTTLKHCCSAVEISACYNKPMVVNKEEKE